MGCSERPSASERRKTSTDTELQAAHSQSGQTGAAETLRASNLCKSTRLLYTDTMTLQAKIGTLAETFASSVLAAIRSASLEDILVESKGVRTTSRPNSVTAAPAKRGPGRPRKVAAAPTKVIAPKAPPVAKRGKGGRLPRRSEADLQKVVGVILGALKQAPEGLRSEHLQKVLKLDKKEISGPISLALSEKKISKKGQKRSTTYFAK